MKYMLLIQQGSTPTPHDPEAWARLSEDERQAVYADYKAINETPGVSPGVQPGRAHGRRDRGARDRGVVAILEQIFREHRGQVLAALIGFLGDFDLAEEAAQEAFAIAAGRWPRDGAPEHPSPGS